MHTHPYTPAVLCRMKKTLLFPPKRVKFEVTDGNRFRCRGRCPHRPGRMHRFYGNLRRICNFSMGRQSRRPLQQPFALSVGADDSVCPRDVPILRESSANSQLPPTSKEVTACGFAANSRRNSLHSAGRSRAPPLPTAVAFQRFLRKTNRLWS